MRGLCSASWVCWTRILLVPGLSGADPRGERKELPQNTEVSGRVVCLAEEMNRLYGADLPTGHPHVYGIRSTDGKLYTLLRTKMSEAIFMDLRLHEKDLRFNGRVFPGTQVLEVIGALRSVREGKVYDLYYYCDICAIKSVSPGPCQCCQEEVVLVEEEL